MAGRAPSICNEPGCAALVPNGSRGRCPTHSRSSRWTTPTRSRTSTAGHKARRRRILRRDPTCKLAYPGCTITSTICDHVRALALGGSDTDNNCQGVCSHCHRIKTSREGHYAAGHNVPTPIQEPPERPVEMPRVIHLRG